MGRKTQVRAMNERQYKLVKIFLDQFHVTPRVLVRKWTKYGAHIELHEVCRVMLTVNYEVYAKDEVADEDVLLAVFGR